MGKFFTSLRSRLILLVIITLVPSILFLVQAQINQRKEAKLFTEDYVIYLADVATALQANLVDNVKSVLLTLSHYPDFQKRDTESCNLILSKLVGEYFDYYASFYVADLEGRILCSPPGKHTPPDFHNCEHYQSIVNADDFVISGYHICEHTGKSVLSIGLPIFDNITGEMIYVLNVSLDLKWFYDFMVESGSVLGDEELIVFDENGIILSHYPDNDKWAGYTLPQSSGLYTLWQQGTGATIAADFSGEEAVMAISVMEGVPKKIYVAISYPTERAYEDANQVLRRNITILVGIMAVVVVLMWLLGDSLIVKQAQTLVTATEKLAEGDLSARSGLDYSHGELGQLAEAFDKMAVDLAARDEERERNLTALNTYAQSLEHSNQELRDFANIASHDLQEPLRKIQTFGELLETRYEDKLDERGVDYIQRMRNAALRMQTLIRELLSFTRVTNNNLPIEKVKLNDVLNQVIDDLDWQIEKTQAEIEVGHLPEIEADPIQINQLFQNLISNALKFHAPDQAPIINVFCNNINNIPDKNGMLEIHVQDNGIGFNEKYLDRIFQPFQRLHNRQKFDGLGMGLSICRKIVDQHGGTITATSKPAKGTTFIIRLPKEQPKGK